MADTYRRHCVVEAPIEEVWSIVSDPHTHPEWWPEVQGVEAPANMSDGGEYTRHTKRFGILDMVDTIWVMEPMEHLKEVKFRCTVSGSYMQFSLTPAQEDTFVQIEGGVVPIGVKGRIAQATAPMFFKRWLQDLLDALPGAVSKGKQPR